MTPGEAAYLESIVGYENRLPWRQLLPWVQAKWERIAAAANGIYVDRIKRASIEVVRLAESGRTSPTKLWGQR